MTSSSNPPQLPLVMGHDPKDPDDTIQGALEFVREHLDMEVAYLSEFVDENLVFRAVCAPGFEELCHVGGTMPLDQVYCRHILAGRLPELIADTAEEPICTALPITNTIPIKSHVSVPIRRADGSAYGMFCCLSRSAKKDLTARDLDVVRAFANLSADQINDRITTRLEMDTIKHQIRNVLTDQSFDVFYQPIYSMADHQPSGFEALCRFQSDPYRPPNLWFDDASRVGLQTELEIAVIEQALTAFSALPENVYLSVNASPNTVATGQLLDVFRQYPSERILLEITEHAMVSNYEELIARLDEMRFLGVRVAIDDAGAGYSGLQHIVKLRPDVIKLDNSLTNGIDTCLARRSLAAALVSFAKETNADIVAEGIETEEEFQALMLLGVPLGQGYYLGRPDNLTSATAVFAAAKSSQNG